MMVSIHVRHYILRVGVSAILVSYQNGAIQQQCNILRNNTLFFDEAATFDNNHIYLRLVHEQEKQCACGNNLRYLLS